MPPTQVLAYGGGATTQGPRLEWIERDGRSSVAVEGYYEYRSVALSPDGTKTLAHRHEDAAGGLWLTDLGRAARSRFTLSASHDANAVWSPDGATVAFTSDRDEKRGAIYMKASNGAGDETLVFKAEHPVRLGDWSNDGRGWLTIC
ncbi:MAG: hypothetical protein ACRD2A_17210 [Vicinamibacterales bacterium]